MSGIGEVPAPVMAEQLDLESAWLKVRAKSGMPGVDGITVSRFDKTAAKSLHLLFSQLATLEYVPLPLRLVEIEKKAGGGRPLLLVPVVRDRIAQTAAAQWSASKWNPEFDKSSFAYRPGLGVAQALQALRELRDRGYRWVLDADVRSFFDSIDHSLLMKRIAAWLGSASPLLTWLHQWIEGPIWDGTEITRLERGLPQGSPLSPLLANYYLDVFDRKMRTTGAKWIRYADDLLILARTPFELQEQRQVVERTLADLHLELNPKKTRMTSFDSQFRFLGAEVRQDAILLPLPGPKIRKSPVYIAPLMPPALLRAYQSRHLRPTRGFHVRGRPVVAVPQPNSKTRWTSPGLLDKLRRPA